MNQKTNHYVQKKTIMNINNNSEENKTENKKEPLLVTLAILIILFWVGKVWLLPIVIRFHLALLVAACLVASWLIEIKLTSDMKYTGWFSVIFVIVFFYSGAAGPFLGWDW